MSLFKFFIGLSAIFISFGYVLNVFITYKTSISLHEKRIDDLFEKRLKCYELGIKEYNRLLTEEQNNNQFVVSPEFSYNTSLKTCFYAGGISSYDGDMFYSITDLLTHKAMVKYVQIGGKSVTKNSDSSVDTIEEFNRRKHNLLYEGK